jgi:PadR family transcriptional regulator PadR
MTPITPNTNIIITIANFPREARLGRTKARREASQRTQRFRSPTIRISNQQSPIGNKNPIPHSLMLTSITVIGIVAPMKKTNPSFLNGVPELLVLRLLSRCEMYGYQIVEEIRAQTGGALAFGEGCIYPYLHHLEAEKFVSSRRREVDGRSRNYYQLTARGQKRLEELGAEWTRVTAGVALLMGEKYA